MNVVLINRPDKNNENFVEFLLVDDSQSQSETRLLVDRLLEVRDNLRTEFQKEMKSLTKSGKKSAKTFCVYRTLKNFKVLRAIDPSYSESVQRMNRLLVFEQKIRFFLEGENVFSESDKKAIGDFNFKTHWRYKKLYFDSSFNLSSIPEEERFIALKVFILLHCFGSKVSWDMV